MFTSRASAPPFKQRRRRRRRRRRKQQLSGSGYGRRRLRRGSLRRRKESAAFAAPGSARSSARAPAPRRKNRSASGPATAAPPHTARQDPSLLLPGLRCNLFIYFQSEKMSEPEPRVGWKALSLWRPIAGGRGLRTAPRRDLTHTEPQHRLYSVALAGAEMEVSFYVAEIGNK